MNLLLGLFYIASLSLLGVRLVHDGAIIFEARVAIAVCHGLYRNVLQATKNPLGFLMHPNLCSDGPLTSDSPHPAIICFRISQMADSEMCLQPEMHPSHYPGSAGAVQQLNFDIHHGRASPASLSQPQPR
ncbi:hypothetical protein C8J57DRAFT_1501790 [Mycena rebaudengoi]|nr:hypothetical protein C8J57DRAFT_1501790 [Mycena rebaudengoi]